MRFIAAALALAFMAGTANAAPKHARNESQAAQNCVPDNDGHMRCGQAAQRILSHPRASMGDPRPRAWCGYWMRHHLGVADRAGNRARWWARYGSPAHGPAVGAIVVWRHHVGIITGRTAEGWWVKSGNDGHRVRERVRSVKRAIAFRWPEQRWASR